MSTKPDDVNGFINQDAKEKPGVPLSRWDEYGIVPEGETEVRYHTRATTVTKALDDTWGINRHNVRLTAVGIARRRDLYARMASIRFDDEHKEEIDRICVEAQEAAGSREAANLGKSLHDWTDLVDRGESEPADAPAPWDKDIEAYQTALQRAEVRVIPEFIEQLVVLPGIKPKPVAGTMDRLVEFGTLPKVADLKTGKLNYIIQSTCMQMAIYAHAKTRYDWRTKTHTPMPEVDQDVALLIHLPVNSGKCDLYWLDIAAGWEAVQHALWVREWRKRKNLADHWNLDKLPASPPLRFDVAVERRVALEQRIDTLRPIAGALDMLAREWPADVPTFKHSTSHTSDQLILINQALTRVEARFRVPFGPPDSSDNVILMPRSKS